MQVTTKLIPFAIALAFAGTASAQQVVKIGHVAPISGPSAHLGKDNENAARMAIDELNAKGFTLNGKKATLRRFPAPAPTSARTTRTPRAWRSTSSTRKASR